jgi:hypothetical protein
MALYQQPVNNNLQYTLNTQLSAGGTSAVLSSSVAGIVQAPGVFVVDRVDSAGNKTSTVREYISFTGVSSNTLTGLSKGLAGSTDQVHNVGAIVEFVPDVTWANAIYSAITLEHGITGQHTSLASVSGINTLNLVASQASIGKSNVLQALISSASINNLFLGQLSLASINQLYVTNIFNASGASLQGFPIMPTWIFSGPISAASAQIGQPLTMPVPGTLQWISATLRIGASNSSVAFDITKNGVNMLAGSNVLSIPINGTFASTASIATSIFAARDVLNISISNASSMGQDLTITAFAR